MASARGLLRFLAWCAALAATLLVLHGWEVPGAGGPVDLGSRDPADLLAVLLAGARWVALGCAWYLASVTVLSTAGAVVGWRPLRRLDAVVTLPAVRRLVRAGLGATLAVGISLGPGAAAAAAPGPPGASGQPAPLAQLDEVPGRTAPPPVPETVEVAARSGSHVVQEGESFWSIAADLTAAELGGTPDDAEVFERWVELIDVNRDRLHVPGDPDLLLPGQELRVPGVPT